MFTISRRNLITAAVLTAVTSPAWAKTQTINTDIVIIGGGLGGLSAGSTAVKHGARVVVLEKLGVLGGAGHFPEGSLGVQTTWQKAHGINTTVDQVLDASLEYHHFRADPEVLRALIAGSTDTINEILNEAHIGMRGIRTMYPKNESLMTWHLFNGGCEAVLDYYEKNIRAAGDRAQILTSTPAQKLLTNNGQIVGVEAKSAKGDTIFVMAKKVIIATGGFAANKEMIAKYVADSSTPGMVEPIWLRGPEKDGRTGDGINMAQLVGAGLAGMQTVAGNAPYLPDNPPIRQFSGPDYLKQGRCALAQPWLWVNHEGKRFFNESRGSVFVDVYNAMTTAGGVMYTIFDQKKMDTMVNKGALLPFNAIVLAGVPLKELPKTWEEGMKRGWAFKADTIEDLANQIGVPQKNLRATMERVNKFAAEKKDPDFGRKPEHLEAFDMNHGPYYALKGIRAYFLTLGGVTVTPRFEAKNLQGDVIPNLYVIGQDIGGLYDSTYDLRCEGSASSFAMTSGRLAAIHAIDAIKGKTSSM